MEIHAFQQQQNKNNLYTFYKCLTFIQQFSRKQSFCNFLQLSCICNTSIFLLNSLAIHVFNCNHRNCFYKETLTTMTKEVFADFVDGLAVRKLDKPKLLKAETGRYWSEIVAKLYHFKRGVYTETFIDPLLCKFWETTWYLVFVT